MRSLFRNRLRMPQRWDGEDQAHIEERPADPMIGHRERLARMRAVGLLVDLPQKIVEERYQFALADLKDVDISGSSITYDPTASREVRRCSWTNQPVTKCPGAHISFSFNDRWAD